MRGLGLAIEERVSSHSFEELSLIASQKYVVLTFLADVLKPDMIVVMHTGHGFNWPCAASPAVIAL